MSIAFLIKLLLLIIIIAPANAFISGRVANARQRIGNDD